MINRNRRTPYENLDCGRIQTHKMIFDTPNQKPLQVIPKFAYV